jgi:hypothetical protein
VRLATHASDVPVRSSQFAQRSDAPAGQRHEAGECSSQRSKRSTRSPEQPSPTASDRPDSLAFHPARRAAVRHRQALVRRCQAIALARRAIASGSGATDREEDSIGLSGFGVTRPRTAACPPFHQSARERMRSRVIPCASPKHQLRAFPVCKSWHTGCVHSSAVGTRAGTPPILRALHSRTTRVVGRCPAVFRRKRWREG